MYPYSRGLTKLYVKPKCWVGGSKGKPMQQTANSRQTGCIGGLLSSLSLSLSQVQEEEEEEKEEKKDREKRHEI
jgi:hypothetical protein